MSSASLAIAIDTIPLTPLPNVSSADAINLLGKLDTSLSTVVTQLQKQRQLEAHMAQVHAELAKGAKEGTIQHIAPRREAWARLRGRLHYELPPLQTPRHGQELSLSSPVDERVQKQSLELLKTPAHGTPARISTPHWNANLLSPLAGVKVPTPPAGTVTPHSLSPGTPASISTPHRKPYLLSPMTAGTAQPSPVSTVTPHRLSPGSRSGLCNSPVAGDLGAVLRGMMGTGPKDSLDVDSNGEVTGLVRSVEQVDESREEMLRGTNGPSTPTAAAEHLKKCDPNQSDGLEGNLDGGIHDSAPEAELVCSGSDNADAGTAEHLKAHAVFQFHSLPEPPTAAVTAGVRALRPSVAVSKPPTSGTAAPAASPTHRDTISGRCSDGSGNGDDQLVGYGSDTEEDEPVVARSVQSTPSTPGSASSRTSTPRTPDSLLRLNLVTPPPVPQGGLAPVGPTRPRPAGHESILRRRRTVSKEVGYWRFNFNNKDDVRSVPNQPRPESQATLLGVGRNRPHALVLQKLGMPLDGIRLTPVGNVTGQVAGGRMEGSTHGNVIGKLAFESGNPVPTKNRSSMPTPATTASNSRNPSRPSSAFSHSSANSCSRQTSDETDGSTKLVLTGRQHPAVGAAT